MSTTLIECGSRLRGTVRILGLAAINAWLTFGADGKLKKPHPHGFVFATPVPSSLLLVVVGFAGLLVWHAWRMRAIARKTTGN